MDRHRTAVTRIAAAVRAYFDQKVPYRINHGSTNTTRHAQRGATVDISALGNVLSVNPATKTALVEPNVPMDRLVEATLPLGLVPPVVMEFPGITCGGGYAGTGGESSSFRHGYFDENVASVEMVLADGRVVTATPGGEHAELFHGASGAVGTLGISTLLELRLMEARRYVKTTYHAAGSVAEAIRLIGVEMARPQNDYVDGIIFSPRHAVVVTGEMTDHKPAGEPVTTFSAPGDQWFYLHAQAATASVVSPASGSPPARTDYIPLAEYLFRYDRGGFWVGRSAFRYFWPVPFARWTRRLLDDFLHTRMMYRALHAGGPGQMFVVQDLAVPFARGAEFVEYAEREFGIWPLWLCPLRKRAVRQDRGGQFHPFTRPRAEDQGRGEAAQKVEGKLDETHMLNIGLWGLGPPSMRRFVEKNKDLEAKLGELGGSKWLYAQAYYDEDGFWAQYGGREEYDALRKKYHATMLPSVYDKVKGKEVVVKMREKIKFIWPLGGFYGLWKSIKSKDYLLHRNSKWKYKEETEAEAETPVQK